MFFSFIISPLSQKGKKQDINRGFYRRVVGPELVQEDGKTFRCILLSEKAVSKRRKIGSYSVTVLK